MPFRLPHPWALSPREAIVLQRKLSLQVVRRDDFGRPRTVAGADLAIDGTGQVGLAGVVLFEFPGLREIGRVWASAPLQFPYIPGLLSFREGPVLLKAFEKLDNLPDLILFDGHGIAHPRRFGIASHMGILLDRPTIGCAKSVLCGTYREPGTRRGNRSPLVDKGETVGAVLRSRDRVRPIFVSVGHRVSLKTAVRIVLQCHDGVRVPKPTREADRFVTSLKRGD